MKKPVPASLLLPLLWFFTGATVFFLVLSDRFTGFAVSELSRFNQGMANLTAGNTDLLVERLKGFALARMADPGLQAWLTSDTSDPVADYEAELGLIQALVTEPFVAGALLLAPDRGSLLDARTRRWNWDEYPDQDLLKAVATPAPYLRMVAGPGWLALPLPPDYSTSKTGRNLVLLINRPLVEEFILQAAVQPSFRAFVLDGQGRVVLGQAPGEGPWTDLLATPADGLRKTVANQVWMFTSRPLQREDWVLVRGVRLEELGEKAVTFQVLLVVVLVALVALSWGGLKWSEVRLTRPFRKLAEEHRALVRQEALRTLLESETLDPQETALIRQDTGFEARQPFTLAAARLEAVPADAPKARREALSEWEARGRTRGWVVLGIDPGGDTLFLVVQFRGRAVEEGLDSLVLAPPMAPMPSLAWAAEVVVPGRDRVKFAADALRELTFLKFLTGEAKVYREADMARTLNRHPAQGVQEEAEVLAQAVRSGQPADLDTVLAGLVDEYQDLPYAECRLRLVMVTFLLFREFSPQIADDGGFQGLEKTLAQFTSLADAGRWLGERLSEVQSRLATPSQGARRQQVLAEVEALLREELADFTLNLDRVAAHVGLSAGYLRQIFKEARGITLSDHLHHLRMARVKDQLEHSDLPVSRLIERSGFQTKSHFFTAFKVDTGMTPDQYRRSKRILNK